jgi:tetratricopeptide (TPR) repeat protein
LVRAENKSAVATARELLSLAEARQDRIQLMIGHRAVGMVNLHTGDLVAAREHLETALGLYDEKNDGPLAFTYGTDHAQTIASFLCMTLWLLGKPDEARARESWAETHGARVGHLYSQVQTAMFRIIIRGLEYDWDAVDEMAQKTLDLSLRHSFGLAIDLCRFYIAASRVLGAGRYGDIDEMRRAVQAWGPLNYRPLYLGLVSESLGRAGQREEALRVLAEAHTLAQATDERWFEAELYRLKGELAHDVHQSISDYSVALEIARRQSARSLELRAAADYARVLNSSGRSEEAKSVVAPVQF